MKIKKIAALSLTLLIIAGYAYAADKADVTYDYDPSTKVGDNVFGTIICDFENDAPSRCSHGGPVCMEYPNGDLVPFYANTRGSGSASDAQYSWARLEEGVHIYGCYPLPEGDYTQNCVVDLADMSYISQYWNVFYDLSDLAKISENWMSGL